ncbi:DUF6233 domain-containing protein [Streptomyces olivaceiscleroticus]|uniref:Ada DNA repair metal-binding domain-containing protein n=1 Tax=Streptomyces olivaceiscleroticus TaxID=68245 RepID=A0ABN1BMN3_9ACTN
MNEDLPPDLPRLRTLETWLGMQLDRVRHRIAQLEAEAAAHEQRRTPAPRPDWLIEPGISGRPISVHTGDCGMSGKRPRPVTRDQARNALAEGVEPCGMCRPDTALGID